MEKIGERDEIILNSIFNPFLPIGESIYDGDLTQELNDRTEAVVSLIRSRNITLPTNKEQAKFFYKPSFFLDDEEVTPTVSIAKEIEVRGIKAAESGNLEEAEKLFTEALLVANRASGYNNRAQVLRLKGDNEAAMEDLNKAIEVSEGRGKAGCQAFCQRGLLNRRCGRDSEAKHDFTQAAQLGSLFAKRQLVEMNPYAAMCNQMLSDMMAKLNGIHCLTKALEEIDIINE